MMRYCLFVLMNLLLANGFAQVDIYDPATIPADLKKNAFSVKRDERIFFEVRSADKATYTVHKVVTVLKEAGKDELLFYEFTDQFHSLDELTIEVFGADGISKKKYYKDDLSKQTAGDGLVVDGKVYYLNIPVSSFPVTIQTDYVIKYKGILNYPDYEVQEPEQAVERSVFIAKVPAELDLRFKEKNVALPPVRGSEGKYKTYTWTTANLSALVYEEGSVSRESRYPRILLSPNKFELDGYPGDLSSWKSFGYWYGSLTKNTVDLSEERKHFFQDLVKDAANDKEKAAIIYHYLQQNCRYVLITLGIGGFKPFQASFVDKKKYGDCKALSNYTQACLAAVGIKSYQALINAQYNKEPVDPEFPHNSFNHVILCIPFQKDSVWLECTSTTNEFGVLGSFTENRNALLITEDGGKLVPTPKSRATANIIGTNTIIDLQDDGSGIARILLNTTGEYNQDFFHNLFNEKTDDQKKYLVNQLGFLQPDNFELSHTRKDKYSLTTVRMEIEKVPDFSAGTKMFLAPRINKIWMNALPKADNRTLDFYFQHPFIKTDTTIYQLPQGYTIETLPKAKDLKFAYGSYTTTYHYDDIKRIISTTARLVLNEYHIPVSQFAVTRVFFDAVLAEYDQKIVIKK